MTIVTVFSLHKTFEFILLFSYIFYIKNSGGFLHPFCVHLFQPDPDIDFPLLIGFLSFRPVVLRLYIGTARRIPQRIAVFAFTGVYHRVRLVCKTADVPLLQLCVFPRFSGICDFRLLPDAGAAGSVNLFVQPDVFSFRQHAD